MSLQIAVNLANDLFDSLSGVDNEQRVGPVRVVQAGLISLPALALTCNVAMLLGLYLAVEGGWWILALCVLSLLGVFAYSAGSFLLTSNVLGEVTVLIFLAGWLCMAVIICKRAAFHYSPLA
jgi:1,4-dihydroxy-2-naphthoate octaprenyltransferase